MIKLLAILLTLTNCSVYTGPAKEAALVEKKETIDQFAERLLPVCNVNLSELRRKVSIAQIIRISSTTFEKQEQQEAFLYLICIESKFDNGVKSKVGAVGYTQLMPKFFIGFAKSCGYETAGDKDIYDSEINLTVGACVFKQLLNKFDGNTALALAGYNSGPDSATTKSLSKLGSNGQAETFNYVAKFAVLRERMK